ncbi:hypothetical protein LCGC14_2363660 [marine sediment metagenome]|uniref:FCP1 homology domain-containing protein n=1 Tax=marine sediment metagenome TaxID=412755 RepID=A0A0F9EIB0_9ZZZZ
MKKFKRIICVDFDGVIHSYTSGWQGIANIPDPLVPGALEWLRRYTFIYDRIKNDEGDLAVQIYSARSRKRKGRQAMRKWLKTHGLEDIYLRELKFPSKKPAAFLTIDDRAICFTGTFPTAREMLDFKPWYKRGDDNESSN